MARVGNHHKRAMRASSRRFISEGPVPEDCGCLTARLQMLRPGYKPPGAWVSDDVPCADYAARFSTVVSLPFWLLNDRAKVHALIAEAIVRGRRRWALECGNLFENLPLEMFTSVLEQVGRSVDHLSPRDAENLWLEPEEWLEPSV